MIPIPVLALFLAEFKHFFRERVSLFWMFGFPVFFMLIFGLVFGGAEEELSLRLGVVVEEESGPARGVLQGLAHVPFLELHRGEREGELAALKEGDRDGVLVIPGDLATRLGRGEEVPFTLYYDASRPTAKQVLISVMHQVFSELEERMLGRVSLLALAPQPVQRQELRPIDYLVPGVLAMTLMQLGLFGVAGALVEMRARGILRRFWATPLRRSAFVSAMVAQRLVISLVQAALILAVGGLVFGVPIIGEPWVMAGVVLLGALVFVSLGYAIASFARSAEASTALLQIINFPMMFLSGIFWPVEWMPGFLRPVIYALPLTYLGDALRQTMVGATPFVPLEAALGVLGGWLLLSVFISIRFFRWE
ncbi:TPA: ABC transporter permease [Candidatus Bipolaricaulota bacterium]|nr:ABC transporter permease [Candidatus Bipolaricaulota bacterium]